MRKRFTEEPKNDDNFAVVLIGLIIVGFYLVMFRLRNF
jgi:hypothetical protein